jgi:TonB family protein
MKSLSRFALSWLWALALSANLTSAADSATPPTADEKILADGLALLRVWYPPTYPPAALKARQSGIVTVRLIVDTAGRVRAARALEESDTPFIDSAVAAVKSWSFSPAIERGQVIECCLDTLVTFSPAMGQQPKTRENMPPDSQTFSSSPRTQPQALVTPAGGYPEILVERKLPGAVRFSCTVSVEGHALESRILAASHSAFVIPAVEALNHWEFAPGTWGDLKVIAPIEGIISFDSLTGTIGEIYKLNGITTQDDAPPTIIANPAFMVDPIWPLDRLLAGEAGSASVVFTIGQSGRVSDVRVQEATKPEFGEALSAAVQCWAFERPMETLPDGSLILVKHADFAAIAPDATGDAASLARLVLAVKSGQISGAKGLDEKVTPLYRVAPIYPTLHAAGARPAGSAEIEFIVDRDGRAQLPRIVTASQPEFGWAAATAVSQWVFKGPRRGGQPVDVKVKIPFNFSAPSI